MAAGEHRIGLKFSANQADVDQIRFELDPAAELRVTGDFDRGDAVAIFDPDGREIARGLAGLGREEADAVKGKNSKAVSDLLGFGTRSEMVHRDNMVVLMGLEARV